MQVKDLTTVHDLSHIPRGRPRDRTTKLIVNDDADVRHSRNNSRWTYIPWWRTWSHCSPVGREPRWVSGENTPQPLLDEVGEAFLQILCMQQKQRPIVTWGLTGFGCIRYIVIARCLRLLSAQSGGRTAPARRATMSASV